jgi:RND family efflux transporter MFP subunit
MTTGQAALDRRRLPEAEARPANGMPQPRALEGARTETPHSPPRAARSGVRFLGAGLAAVAGVVAVTAFMVAGRTSVVPITTGPAPAMTVTEAMPQRTTWAVTMEASGLIAPWQEASISAQIGGYRLADVLVNVGDEVKKGQALARFDRDLLLADEAQLKARFEQAEANRQRSAALKGRGYVSDKEFLQYETDAKSADALLASKQLQLHYSEVVAPDSGAISSRTATLGAVVPAGQELFRLIRANRLEWRGEFTASQLSRLVAGQRIALVLPDGGSAFAAVRQIAPALDPQSRLGIVYADIETGSHARAGMYASGKVILGGTEALAVPAESVVIRDGRSYVLVLAQEDAVARVSLRAVTAGRREGGEVEIVTGLAGAERVVAQGAGFLGEGDIVRLAPSRGAPTAASDLKVADHP